LEAGVTHISTIGWILIAAIAAIVISSYWSLLSLLRNKNKKPDQPSWVKSWQVLNKPWEAENKQLGELSKKVSDLTHSDSSTARPDDPHS